jgi:hypothetical protein
MPDMPDTSEHACSKNALFAVLGFVKSMSLLFDVDENGRVVYPVLAGAIPMRLLLVQSAEERAV